MSELTYEKVLELFAESDRRLQLERIENDKRFDQKISKVTSELAKKISQLGDTLGRYAEEQVKADLVNKFLKWGIPVHSYTTHFVQQDQNNEFIYEVDILIYNSNYVIALEVKNQIKKDDIDEHIERMAKIKQHPLPDTKGKILLAGVASMIVGNGLEQYAESKGLFFIKPSGETVKIVNKKTFKPREWVID